MSQQLSSLLTQIGILAEALEGWRIDPKDTDDLKQAAQAVVGAGRVYLESLPKGTEKEERDKLLSPEELDSICPDRWH